MKKINPYFEANGSKFELKATRWLIKEYRRLNEESPLSEDDRMNAVTASNLVADVRKYAEKVEECWEALCADPTEENQRKYLLFKGMSDKAIADYNEFAVANNTLQNAFKHNIDILEQVAIKALQEQYFNGNESLAKQTWEMFVDETDDHNKVAEWLNAMAECLFVNDEEEEEVGFIAEKRKYDQERENNRKNGFRKKR